MAEKSKIEWTDSTFSPWVGCTPVSPACHFCYAESWAKRSGHPELWKGERRRTKTWQDPLKWQKNSAVFQSQHGRRQRVFCASLADVFDNQVPERWRDDLWFLIDDCPDLDWLLLTKRPQNIRKMLPNPNTGVKSWGAGGWPNVWLGTTTEDQERADQRMPHLLNIDAVVHFISAEPLLSDLLLRHPWLRWNCAVGGRVGTPAACDDCDPCLGAWGKNFIDWVITGGESGGSARPTNPAWFRSLRDQCVATGTPFLHKQNGEFVSVSEVEGHGRHHTFENGATVRRLGKRKAGRTIDGVEWTQFPQPQGR